MEEQKEVIRNRRYSPQEKIKELVKELKNDNLTRHDILLNFFQEEETLSKIFDNQTIDTLEKVTKYLKGIKRKKTSQKEAVKKHLIPITIFSDRTLSALEHLVTYLKEHHGLNYKDIAVLLNRDQRTVWTTYQRARKKRE